MPVLQDLTLSHREGDWNLHISAVRRALPLFFAFGRTNYSLWVPLCSEDCVALKEKFLGIYASFKEGGFAVRHTAKCGSAVLPDQALEKEYNKPAEGQGGITGFSRRKEAVAQWNIIKHEKAKLTKHLWELCCLTEEDEYSLHHVLSTTLIEADEECVEHIVNYIAVWNNPFDTTTSTVTNIVTGKETDAETASFLIDSVRKREESYSNFRMTKKLLIQFRKLTRSKKCPQQARRLTLRKELSLTLRLTLRKKISANQNIDYERLQDYSIAELLRYELTITAFFLMKGEIHKV